MRNLAARAGQWSASHWKTAVLGWTVFVVAAFSLTLFVQTRELTDVDMSSGNSKVAEEIIAGAGFADDDGESVIIQHPTQRADDTAFEAVVRDVATRLGGTRDVEALQSPLAAGGQRLVSRDRHSALVNFQIPGSPSETSERVGPILAVVHDLQRSHPGYVVEEFGSASGNREIDATVGKDLRRAEQLSLPITLLILVVAFGALVAASIPVLLAFTAVLATYGLAALFSHLLPSSDTTSSIILLIGMAVGMDYSLFYLRREREEVAAGRDRASALRIAAATSGQAVLISGATVIVAMAGMLLAGAGVFPSIAVGAMTVVLVAVIGSLTVLPALLSRLGHGVERGRIPFLGRRGGRHVGGAGMWARILTPVLRRPLVSALSATLLLLLLALPAAGMKTKSMGLADLPENLPIVKTYQRIQTAFPGSSVPAVVAIQASDVTSPGVTRAIAELHRRAVASGKMSEPVDVQVNPAKTVALVNIPLNGNDNDERSLDALRTLRGELIPATVGRLPGARVGVTGDTAGSADFNELMRDRAPLVFAFVLGLAFLLLLFTFRSIVIPIKSILLNLLSVAASYGGLVAIFQHGWGASLFGAQASGGITSWLPLFLFVILFGLSMDYHVFILSRVKELVDRGEPTTRAVERGIKATAGTVTSAAVVMVAVFAVFASLSLVDIKQAGVGLAIAVLLDATVIRGVLLPATMALLGEWNWYLPRWLQWLPRRDQSGSPFERDGRLEAEGAAAKAPGAATPGAPEPARLP
ncbi:MAG TPA: MMPL family transporter [Actinomycetes bacterium]|jgi:RND superfamily putative drug exporter|nr:MMPL family transporter [Actinomycetes bacterium]